MGDGVAHIESSHAVSNYVKSRKSILRLQAVNEGCPLFGTSGNFGIGHDIGCKCVNSHPSQAHTAAVHGRGGHHHQKAAVSMAHQNGMLQQNELRLGELVELKSFQVFFWFNPVHKVTLREQGLAADRYAFEWFGERYRRK